ncbi:uncharacterized protein E5676_scaffold216G001580 [Cucumis melo var. makuwa]|uniref:Uncharacterized protein n=1 Tax=Cucumis melo var. makuwa TaxID=1194695 RepID=A0A5A7UQU4_CUCMM|nr:uncharacterized protein E6C27_scaffold280G003550 [Cucumis melo var. makuwa]TYK30170.1 uncharacterized protein E5676_scaffold216G001580 [Cucumis melo var. makuwa]
MILTMTTAENTTNATFATSNLKVQLNPYLLHYSVAPITNLVTQPLVDQVITPHGVRQCLALSAYYAKTTTIWQNLMEYPPLDECTCGRLKKLLEFLDANYQQGILVDNSREETTFYWIFLFVN